MEGQVGFCTELCKGLYSRVHEAFAFFSWCIYANELVTVSCSGSDNVKNTGYWRDNV